MRPVPAATLLLAASAVLSCGGESAAGGEGNGRAGVDAVVARVDTIRVEIRSVGSLEADQRVEMAAEAAGRITSIAFREGEAVRRGRVLLRVDERKLAAEVDAGEAALARTEREAKNLERQVERNRALLEAGAISPQAFDDLETAYETALSRAEEARAGLAVARARLEEAMIRAPFDGTVGAREVDVGDYVSAGDPLFVLVDDDPLEIEFRVPERYSARLERGSPVRLTLSSHPDRPFEGEVTFISPVVDVQSRTVALKAAVPNPERELRPGQFANVVLGLELRPDAVLVPEAAVVPRAGRTLVFIVRGGRAVQREVALGERAGGRVEVLAGVAGGDTVIVAGQQRIGDGSAVAATVVADSLEGASFAAPEDPPTDRPAGSPAPDSGRAPPVADSSTRDGG